MWGVYWFTSVRPSVFPSVPFFVNFFVKDFSIFMQARMVILQVGDDFLYLGIENQPSPAYSSMY